MANESNSEAPAANTGFLFYVIFTCIAGTLTNFTVVVVILTNKHLQTKTNLIIFNLAIADFFVAVVAVPLRYMTDFVPSSSRQVSCHVVIALTILLDGSSRLHIVLISLERFIAVKFPFWYEERFTKKMIYIAIFCSWSLMGLFAVLLLLGVGVTPADVSPKELCLFSTTLSKAAVLVFTIAFCLCPTAAIIPLNCYLLKTSHRQMRQIQDLQISVQNMAEGEGTAQYNEYNLKQKKVARMVVVLVGLFIILVTPISVIDIIETTSEISVPRVLSKLAVCLIYSNAFLNVFVYAGYNSGFRLALSDLFSRLKNFLTKPCHPTNSL